MSEINISRLHFPVTTLGPGRRIGVWFQGCSIRCEGCISVDTWRENVGTTSVSDVIAKLESWLGISEGVTITGGEPFDQPTALIELLRLLRHRGFGNILVYTGYSLAEVQGTLDAADGLIIDLGNWHYSSGSARCKYFVTC